MKVNKKKRSKKLMIEGQSKINSSTLGSIGVMVDLVNNVLKNRSIVLVGMMGSGKTTIGKKIASKLNRPFLDSDQVIEKGERMPIAEIFDLFGEAAFRQREQAVIQNILDSKNCVLATGGGAFMNKFIRQKITNQAISIWLKTDLETMYKRVRKNHKRPLLNQANPKKILEELMKERDPVYAEADILVQTEDKSASDIANNIIRSLVQYLSKKSWD